MLALDAATDLRPAIDLGVDLDPEFLERILGRFDVTQLEGTTVAQWVTAMVEGGDWRDLVSTAAGGQR